MARDAVDFQYVSEMLDKFAFGELFNYLGWSNPPTGNKTQLDLDDETFTLTPIAELGGVLVLEVASTSGTIPGAKSKKAVQEAVRAQQQENLLIFVDEKRTKSFWYWMKREDSKLFPREHSYFKGQPADLFYDKLRNIHFALEEFDETGDVSIAEVAARLKDALDVEQVTKKFYNQFQVEHTKFLEYLTDITDERKRRWYASVLLNRLMFIYFLQKKRFIDGGDLDYLRNKFDRVVRQGGNYYKDFLTPLFFEGFAKPEDKRDDPNAILGRIPYLNGGLFLEHKIETEYKEELTIANEAFDNILKLFDDFSWNLDDKPGGNANEINPDVLGYIFEKYINQKELGAYYTRPEITEYLCEQTIDRLILSEINTDNPDLPNHRDFRDVSELIDKLNVPLCKALLFSILPNMKLLDPACGSGAFLVAALKKLLSIYAKLTNWIEYSEQSGYELREWLTDKREKHPSLPYYFKKKIITENLFGVDIVEEGVEIAKVRLFLTLVASAQKVADLEPLPNIDFNILPGNSLIGLMQVDPEKFDKKEDDGTQVALFNKGYQELVAEKNRHINNYRNATQYSKELQELRDKISELRANANDQLDQLLLDEFESLGVKYTEVTWDIGKGKEGKKKKRALTKKDIEALQPFHWGYEFSQIVQPRELGGKGGFDAIITNPPWDIFKPNSKEFFAHYSDEVTINKMKVREFKEVQAKLLKDKSLKAEWQAYLSGFPHISEFYRRASQYENQISYVNGKKVGSDINLYKLFTEQCLNLLRTGGQCGTVIPSGIYTDLGAKQLREMLFSETQITGLFCFENRKMIFEGVDSRFKFVVLTFERGERTETFPAMFMRHEVEELELFPQQTGLDISVELIENLSPDSLSITEYRNQADVEVISKMAQFVPLGAWIDGKPLNFSREFMSTDDAYMFNEQGIGLTVWEGKMFEQFDSYLEEPKWWMSLEQLKTTRFYEREDWKTYRFAIRRIARGTDKRTLISSLLPPNSVAVHSVFVNVKHILPPSESLYLIALLNSFVADYFIRLQVSANVSQFFILQLSLPRLTDKDPAFFPIVERAAKLICTTPEFDDLAAEVGAGQP